MGLFSIFYLGASTASALRRSLPMMIEGQAIGLGLPDAVTWPPHSPGNGSTEMLDHVTLGVSDVALSKVFYDSALGPLGIERLYAEGDGAAGYGANKKAFFWIGRRNALQTGVHVAFTAPDRETVDRFHKAALAAGGKDNGPPGLRPQYHKNYYGAFVLDPDGHNIEAVCHGKIG
jgi:catechol 2,3-dioxygenase-like lactoylglutathione lyase family enzyme